MMIFKRWFAPKWQHKDAAVRQQAITELTLSQEHKQALHELAFNDSHEAVRRAALEKLNEFSLWWQASKHESSERLKQHAEQMVIEMVLENKISGSLKQQFIHECNRSSVLDKLALTEPDAQIRFALLQRLQKTELLSANLHQDVLDLEQKRTVLAWIKDEKVLEKLSRQLSEPLQSELKAKLHELALQREKPIQLRKQVQLVLAKLNSVREKGALELMEQKWQQFEQEWQALVPELAVLPEANEFLQKFAKISQQTQQAWAPLLELQAKAQAKAQVEQQKMAQKAALEARLQALVGELQTRLTEGDFTQSTALESAVDEVLATVKTSELEPTARQALKKQADELKLQILKMPEQGEQLAKLFGVIATWQSLVLPVDADSYLAVRKAYQECGLTFERLASKLGHLVPKALYEAKQALQDSWQPLMSNFSAELEREQKYLKSKLSEFKRLHEAGRFNVLFGLLKGIEQQFARLPLAQQALLSKDMEQARSVVADLTELQSYIATPRKQELLEHMQSIAAAPVAEIAKRAAEVKQARQTWQSLGKAAPEQEEALNQAFNVACEQAFAPCREFYAKQDEERAAHASAKRALLDELRLLQQQPASKELDIAFTKLQQQWRAVGPVDARVHQELSADYKALSEGIRQQLRAWQQLNAQAKQQLIKQAGALDGTEPAQAISAVKSLQQQWKAIGFAGRDDQALWKQFRVECDKVFATLTLAREERQHQAKQELEQAEQAVAALQAQLQPEASLEQLEQVLAQLTQLMVPAKSELATAKQELRQTVMTRLDALKTKQKNAGLEQLLHALETQNLDAVPSAYREQLQHKVDTLLSREQLTWAIAMLNGQTPLCSEADRAQVQLLLLSEKHNQNHEISAQSLLQRWLSFGMPNENERPLIGQLKQQLLL